MAELKREKKSAEGGQLNIQTEPVFAPPPEYGSFYDAIFAQVYEGTQTDHQPLVPPAHDKTHQVNPKIQNPTQDRKADPNVFDKTPFERCIEGSKRVLVAIAQGAYNLQKSITSNPVTAKSDMLSDALVTAKQLAFTSLAFYIIGNAKAVTPTFYSTLMVAAISLLAAKFVKGAYLQDGGSVVNLKDEKQFKVSQRILNELQEELPNYTVNGKCIGKTRVESCICNFLTKRNKIESNYQKVGGFFVNNIADRLALVGFESVFLLNQASFVSGALAGAAIFINYILPLTQNLPTVLNFAIYGVVAGGLYAGLAKLSEKLVKASLKARLLKDIREEVSKS